MWEDWRAKAYRDLIGITSQWVATKSLTAPLLVPQVCLFRGLALKKDLGSAIWYDIR